MTEAQESKDERLLTNPFKTSSPCCLPDDNKALRGRLDLNYKASGFSRQRKRYIASFLNVKYHDIESAYMSINTSNQSHQADEWRLLKSHSLYQLHAYPLSPG